RARSVQPNLSRLHADLIWSGICYRSAVAHAPREQLIPDTRDIHGHRLRGCQILSRPHPLSELQSDHHSAAILAGQVSLVQPDLSRQSELRSQWVHQPQHSARPPALSRSVALQIPEVPLEVSIPDERKLPAGAGL